MRRSTVVAFAIGAALLMVTASPAAAADADLEVASEYTTDSDFNNATTLTNATVQGSGESAVVAADQNESATASQPAASTSVFDSEKHGVAIEPQTTLTDLTVELYTGSGATDVYLENADTDTQLRQKSVSGSSVTFSGLALDPGTEYWILADDGGDSHTIPANTSADTPIQSSTVDIVRGVKPGQIGTVSPANETYHVRNVTGEYLSDTAVYIGASHSASSIDEGYADLTLSNAEATITWQTSSDGGSTWSDAASATYTTDGNRTIDLSTTSADLWRARMDVTKQAGTSTAELDGEGVLFTAQTPTGSNPDPADNSDVESYDGDISLDVSDADFSTAQGDVVTVSAADVNGNQIGEQDITSNQTVSFDHTVKAGDNNVTWTLSDSYGESATVDQDFTAPSGLSVYNASNASEKISPTTVTAISYSGETILENETTTGEIDLSGHNASEPIVVVLSADGYQTRRIIIASLIDQQEAYLLPENATDVDTVFEVQAYDVDYPQGDTALLIQRGIDGSWETVTGDRFGATGEFPAQLELNTRYRLVLFNLETGERRVAGSYTPLTASEQTVEISSSGEINVIGRGISVFIAPDTRTLLADSGESVTVTIDEAPDASFENATVNTTYRSPDGSTTDLGSTSIQAPGETEIGVDLSNRSGGELLVTVNYNSSFASGSETATYAIREHFGSDNSLLAVLGSVAPRFPAGHVEAFQNAVVLLVTVLVSVAAASAGATTESSGASAVLVLGGFGTIGWVGYDVVFIAGAAFVSFAALRRGL